MSGLSREVIKWIQSLDLSYSVKNVKRDFANGFLVAEIFSRYYQQDIQMHSFDNGSSLPKKLDNWAQLEKFFRRNEIPITRDLIDEVIHVKEGAVTPLVETVYQFLTGKKLVPLRTIKPPEDDNMPPFARPTVSNLIKDSIRDSELATTMQNSLATQQKAQDIMSQQSEAAKNDRTQNEARVVPTASMRPTLKVSSRVPQRTLDHSDESQPKIEFKDVQVRAVDRNAAQLRASRDLAASGRSSLHSALSQTQTNRDLPENLGGANSHTGVHSVPSNLHNTLGSVPNQPSATNLVGSTPAMSISKTATDIVNASVHTVCHGTEFQKSWDPSRDAILNFLDNINRIPSDVASGVFSDIAMKTPVITELSLQHPKEFWKISSYFNRAFADCEDHETFFAAVSSLAQIADKMLSRDPAVTLSMFVDYVLPRLCNTVHSHRPKRGLLMQLVYSFCSSDVRTHINMVKTLQDCLESIHAQDAFLHCMSLLLPLERELDESLLDLYIYYTEIGLGMSSPFLRAACLSMLPLLVNRGHSELVSQLLSRHKTIFTDTWWEVLVQALLTNIALLHHMPSSSDDAPVIYEQLRNILLKCSPRVKQIGLTHVTGLLTIHPELTSMYIEVLLAMDSRGRAPLLKEKANQKGIQMHCSDAREYPIELLPASWDINVVTQAFCAYIKDKKVANFEQEHIEVLLVFLESGEESVNWVDIFEQVKNFLYVSLCDEEVCKLSSDCIMAFMTRLGEPGVKSFTTLVNSLRMIFPQNRGSATCRRQVIQLMNDLFELGEPFSSGLYQLITKFPDDLKHFGAPLSDFVSQVQRKYR